MKYCNSIAKIQHESPAFHLCFSYINRSNLSHILNLVLGGEMVDILKSKYLFQLIDIPKSCYYLEEIFEVIEFRSVSCS